MPLCLLTNSKPGKDQVDQVVERLGEQQSGTEDTVVRLKDLSNVSQRVDLCEQVSAGHVSDSSLAEHTAAKKDPFSHLSRDEAKPIRIEYAPERIHATLTSAVD